MSVSAPPAPPSAPTPPAATRPAATTTATPTPRALVRRWGFWIAAGAFVVVASIVLLLVRGGSGAADAEPLSITSAAPGGSKALAEVLRQHGVTVTAVGSLDEAEAAVAAAGTGSAGPGTAGSGTANAGAATGAAGSGTAGSGTAGSGTAATGAAGSGTAAAGTGPTVLIYDPNGYLPGDRYADVSTLGARLVLVQPDVFELEGVAPSISVAGAPDGPGDNSTTVEARCALPAAVRAGAITVSGTTYRATDGSRASATPGASAGSGTPTSAGTPADSGTPTSAGTPADSGTTADPGTPGSAAGTISCFASAAATGDAPAAYSLVTSDAGPVGVSVLGAPDVLTNEQIANSGNAALALGLLGQSDTLIWYVPTAADLTVTGPPSLAALTPGWVTPVAVLLVLVFVAAAVWRGRRFGALVVENLPVIVRSNETLTGRARLYARSGARTRALDALRIGTAGRLARMLGLSRRATLDDIVLATAARTGLAPAAVADTLVNRLPGREAELLDLSQRLAELEAAVRASVYGEHPPQASTGSAPTRST